MIGRSNPSIWQISLELRRYGRCLREQSTSRRVFFKKKGSCFPIAYYRIFYALWWEMKNRMRKWWREHDTEELGHSIIAGTMRRMHKCSKLKGMPACDYYTVSWISASRFDTYRIPTYGEFDLNKGQIGLRFFQKIDTFFCKILSVLKSIILPISERVYLLFSKKWKKF